MRSHYRTKKLEKKQKWRKIRRWIFLTGGVLLLLAVLRSFLIGNVFQIKNITVQSELPINETEIIDQAKAQVISSFFGGILGSNHYLSWPKEIKNENPELATLEIEKNWKEKTITIIPTQRRTYLTWCTVEGENQTTCYWVDQEGIIFDNAPIAEGNFITTIYDYAENPKPIIIGDSSIAQTSFEYIKNILNTYKKLDLSIEKIILNRDLEEFHVKIRESGTVLFSLRFDPTINALPALEKLYTERNFSKLNYLDLTVDGRAFYKEK